MKSLQDYSNTELESELRRRGFNLDLVISTDDVKTNLDVINESIDTPIHLTDNQMKHIVESIDTVEFSSLINEDIQHYIFRYQEK